MRAISRTIASVPTRATSYSGTPSVMALRMASPPRSPIRAPCLMTSISSADLSMRCRMAACGDVHQGGAGEGGLDLAAVVQGRVSSSTPSAGRVDAAGAQRSPGSRDVVVAVPVGVDDVVPEAATPRHAGVDVRGDGEVVVLGDDQGVGAAERGEEEVGVVLDVVVAGQQRRRRRPSSAMILRRPRAGVPISASEKVSCSFSPLWRTLSRSSSVIDDALAGV